MTTTTTTTRTAVARRDRLVNWNKVALYAALFVFLFVVLSPFFWIVKSSVSGPDELFKVPPVYLPHVTMENYRALADQVPLYEYVRNSLVYSVSSALLSVSVSFMAAYAFARISVPGRNLLLWLFVLTMALPEIATIIPLYRLLAEMKMLDSLIGLVIVMSSVLVPFTVWVLVAFIQQVPYEIEEAAIIDGANLFQIFRRIMIPLTSPALATMLVINFINAWNNLLYPLAFSVSPKSKTLSVAITEVFQARSPWGRPWNMVSALGVAMVIPAIILVLFSQKAIVRGLTRGAIK
ncbi:carbohydrate ABC transporter permease [Aggregatilinea lenta]|uniref:carbohydrate ABC transporter permease n=1 Tax=Aggregatilinea lenta TaxID=913108 RepID=UPI0013C2C805|nr:carbohydrate ABC transporter permease [Aggregatilinea lenta]